jgi:putative ABC transport system permease protein
MNLFQLVLKQMRQRALSTWLTLLSVMLGVALAIAIFLIRRESAKLFGQTAYGYDVIVGAKGSPLQLVMNTVYHIDRSPGNIPYSLYQQFITSPSFRPSVRIAVPTAVGDTYRGYRIVGTIPQMFGFDETGSEKIPPERTLEYRPGKRYEIGAGRVFHGRRFEAVVGSDVPRLTGLRMGDKFKATHGMPLPGQTPDEHEEEWTVVGVMKPTQTAADRVLFISLPSFYAIGGHKEALEVQSALRGGADLRSIPSTAPADAYGVDADGNIVLNLPPEKWMISAVLVRTRAMHFNRQFMYVINNRDEATAVNPAQVMREFFDTFLDPSTKAWGAVAVLVSVVAIVAILVSIYNSIAGRIREIAILRALGATRRRILTLICVEAGLIGLIGGAAGLLAGHAIGAAASGYMERTIGEGLQWWVVDRTELLYLSAVVVTCVLAGLVPALKAYRTPVAANLVAG